MRLLRIPTRRVWRSGLLALRFKIATFISSTLPCFLFANFIPNYPCDSSGINSYPFNWDRILSFEGGTGPPIRSCSTSLYRPQEPTPPAPPSRIPNRCAYPRSISTRPRDRIPSRHVSRRRQGCSEDARTPRGGTICVQAGACDFFGVGSCCCQGRRCTLMSVRGRC